jgi:predicted ATPase
VSTTRVDPDFLEREQSIVALDGLLAGVRSRSEGRLVFLGGEAGVGKTALLRRFSAAQPAAVRILWGACEPLRTPRPLGPLVDVAEEIGGELQRLVARAGKPHEVAAALLRELRRGTPTVLVLEDVHWARVFGTKRSRRGSSSPNGRSITTSPRSCASSLRARRARLQ